MSIQVVQYYYCATAIKICYDFYFQWRFTVKIQNRRKSHNVGKRQWIWETNSVSKSLHFKIHLLVYIFIVISNYIMWSALLHCQCSFILCFHYDQREDKQCKYDKQILTIHTYVILKCDSGRMYSFLIMNKSIRLHASC